MGPRTEDLVGIARLVFGERWQHDLAESLGMSDRQVRRWLAGVCDAPPSALRMARYHARTRLWELQAALAGFDAEEDQDRRLDAARPRPRAPKREGGAVAPPPA